MNKAIKIVGGIFFLIYSIVVGGIRCVNYLFRGLGLAIPTSLYNELLFPIFALFSILSSIVVIIFFLRINKNSKVYRIVLVICWVIMFSFFISTVREFLMDIGVMPYQSIATNPGFVEGGIVIFCTVASDKNTKTTINGDVVYCDKSLRMWTPTIIPSGTLTKKTWGPEDEIIDSCIGKGSNYPACNYCDNLTYAGFTDWQLPTSDVLTSFWTIPCSNKPCGLENAGVNWDTNAQADYYWSSTAEKNGVLLVAVSFSNGWKQPGGKSFDLYVRCVRGQ